MLNQDESDFCFMRCSKKGDAHDQSKMYPFRVGVAGHYVYRLERLWFS